MWFVRSEDGKVIHRRDEINSISASCAAGKSFSGKLAKMGFLPCMGASEPLRPSSWQGCRKCPPRVDADVKNLLREVSMMLCMRNRRRCGMG